MYSDRLLKLAVHLDCVNVEHFDMNRWKSSCGTVACAIGHAATIPEFQKLGLRMNNAPEYPTGHYSEGCTPTFEGFQGLEAAARFFGISHGDAVWLFLGSSYVIGDAKVHPSEVAHRIRLYVYD